MSPLEVSRLSVVKLKLPKIMNRICLLGLLQCRNLVGLVYQSALRMLGLGVQGFRKIVARRRSESARRQLKRAADQVDAIPQLPQCSRLRPHEVLRLRELRQQSALGGCRGSCEGQNLNADSGQSSPAFPAGGRKAAKALALFIALLQFASGGGEGAFCVASEVRAGGKKEGGAVPVKVARGGLVRVVNRNTESRVSAGFSRVEQGYNGGPAVNFNPTTNV